MQKVRANKVREALQAIVMKHRLALPLNRADFETIAKGEGIALHFTENTLRGLYFAINGDAVILLNPSLPDRELTHTAFHELAHALIHSGRPKGISPGDRKKEVEADLFADLATRG